MVEVVGTDLAMSRSEAKLLLRLHESTVDDAALDRLLELTEGWATGLYLAVLANAGRPVKDWLPHVRGDQHEIAAYLAAEVLDGLPARCRPSSPARHPGPALGRAVPCRDRHGRRARAARAAGP